MAGSAIIDLVARINTEESEKLIQSQLNGIASNLKLNVKCNIDTKDIGAIQKQLSQLSNSLVADGIKLPTIVDTNANKNITNNVVAEFNKAFGMIGKMGEMSKKEFNAQTKQMLQELKNAWQEGMGSGNFAAYEEALGKLQKRIREFSKGDVQKLAEQIKELQMQFTDFSKVSVESSLVGWLKKATGNAGLAQTYLDAIYGKGSHVYSDGNTRSDTLLKNATNDTVNELIEAAKKILEYKSKINSVGWGLEELEEAGATDVQILREVENRLREIVGLSRIETSGTFFDPNEMGLVSKGINTAADASMSLHRKQELLQQDYDILAAKITKAKQSIDEIATRDGVNYNNIFSEIMGGGISNNAELSAARDALSAIRKEFQLVNAQMASDLPQNAIEALVQRIAKVDSQIKTLTLDYGKLSSVPADLAESFSKLQNITQGFDFSPDYQVSSKEALSSRLQQYTQIRIALNDTQSLLKVAQKEEAAHNKEISKALKEREKEIALRERQVELARQLREQQQHEYWQGRFEDSVKSLTAENQILKDMKKYYMDLAKVAEAKDRAFNKEFEAELKKEEKTLALEQQRVEAAKQLREEQQHEYWQGRFEETVKGQTADNQVLKDMKKYYEDLEKAATKANQEQNKLLREDNRTANLANRIKTLTANMNAYAVANDRAVKSTKEMSSGRSFADEWARLSAQMARGAELTDREVKDLTADFRVFGKEAEMAGLKGDSAFGKFLSSFKTMSSYITANMVFNFVKRQIREMVNEVITIDTAMTELRKVTEATNAEFEKFAQNAGKTGKELGATISDVINATSTFSRAGYNLPDAEELGRVATLYKNVGDGINIDTASESLVSILKAFNIEAAESERVLDRINEVSNSAAIESGGLGFALQRVASAMDAANNSLDQTIALVTSANEIVENPEMVAQGWRTVALRIRGAKTELEQAGEDTEGMVESTAKLRDLIKGISGVDIMLDENTFKSTYDIIDELGKVWKNISDINQASLLEAIAGKRQSNIVAATLNNYERLEEILKISENSAGSAMREQEEYSKSIQFSINTLKAAYQDFAQTAIDKGIIKDLLGTAQSFLEVLTKIVDKIGLLPTILGSIAMINGIRGKGKQNRICLFTHRCDLCVEINALKQ